MDTDKDDKRNNTEQDGELGAGGRTGGSNRRLRTESDGYRTEYDDFTERRLSDCKPHQDTPCRRP